MLSLQQKQHSLDRFALLVGRTPITEVLDRWRVPLRQDSALSYLNSYVMCRAISDVYEHFFPDEWRLAQDLLRHSGSSGYWNVLTSFTELCGQHLFPLHLSVYDEIFEDDEGRPLLIAPFVSQGFNDDSLLSDMFEGWVLLGLLLGEWDVEETEFVGTVLGGVLAMAQPPSRELVTEFLTRLEASQETPLTSVALMFKIFFGVTGNEWIDADEENNFEYIRLVRADMESARATYAECRKLWKEAELGRDWLAVPDNLARVVEMWNACPQ